MHRIAILLSHGLHESEARVYLALLEQPALPAGTLAKVADVPRSHLYKLLQDMHAQGLVDILVEGHRRLYRARPFAEFLARKRHATREQLAQIEDQLRNLAPALEPPPLTGAPGEAGDLGDLKLIFGRRMIVREVEAMLERARTMVVIACSDGSWPRGLAHVQAHAAAWRAAGVAPEVRVHLSPAAAARDDWQALLAIPRCSVRWFDIPRATFSVVVDRREMIHTRPIPDVGDMRVGRDIGVYSRDPVFVADYEDLLAAAAARESPPALRRSG